MSTTSPPALEDSLGFNLHRVAQLYRRELIRALADHDLTPEQWQILAALSGKGEGMTQGEIAELTFKDKHSMSRMLDRMEASGWILRTLHPGDARAAMVILGKRGTELGKIRRVVQGHFARINSALNDDQQRRLLGMLKTLRARLGDQPEGETP